MVNSKEAKSIIKSYVELRNQNLKVKITRSYFEQCTGVSRHFIEKYFGSYTALTVIGEKLLYERMPLGKKALLSESNKKFDASATMEDCINDLRKVQKDNYGITITRNLYRSIGRYSDSTWNRLFGTFQEFRRQAGLELSRQQHKLEKQIALHASASHYKEFYNTEILPYFEKYSKKCTASKIKTIMVISDIHDIECDRFTLSVFIDTCKRKQPDVIVLNGDIFDMYEFSGFTKDPRSVNIKERFQFVWDNVFKELRTACPKAQIDFIVGNHEFRLIRLLADATPNLRVLLSDVVDLKFKDIFKVDEYQINFISKFDLSAFNKRDINDELKKNYAVYYGCYVVCHEPDKSLMVMSGTNGHHHRLEMRSDAFIDRSTAMQKQLTWVQTPSCHVVDADYLSRMSKWNTGFLEVTVNTDLQQVIQKIHQTHEWAVIDGVMYERI